MIERLSKLSLIIFLSVLINPSLLFSQQNYQDWLKDQQNDLQAFNFSQNNYNTDTTRAYQNYIDQQKLEFQNYKNQIEQKWDTFRGNTKNRYVDYDKDLNARGSVDFENGEIEIEVLMEDDLKSKEEDQNKLISKKLENKINQIVSIKTNSNQTLLENQLENKNGEKVTSKNVKRYSEEIVKNKPIKKKVIKSKDGKVRIKYALTISLLPEHLQIRVRRYKDDVINESKRFKIDPAMVLAIMHTESSFNPKAESPVPAYGLMQLVPKTGARDAYLYVYNKDKLLTANYLFNPKNNIELGCAYLKKIRSVYFKDIKNDLSATYCMIAAYNTGPGNLAKAFTGNKKLSPAIREINALSPNEVYLKLVNDLTHKESRSYLKKVTSRIEYYK